MYKVVFTKRALKDLENIDRETQNRIAIKLKEHAKYPQKYARKLINPNIGGYRFRISKSKKYKIKALTIKIRRNEKEIQSSVPI